jgi:hypothetical protein
MLVATSVTDGRERWLTAALADGRPGDHESPRREREPAAR